MARRAVRQTRRVSNEEFKLGDTVSWGNQIGVVVGIIERGEYAEPGSAHRWRPLGRGILVRTSEGEVFHFRDAAGALTRRR